jgi:hypothetical protein
MGIEPDAALVVVSFAAALSAAHDSVWSGSTGVGVRATPTGQLGVGHSTVF